MAHPPTVAIAVPSRDRWFFSGMAIAAAVSVFAGFAPTFYLKAIFGTPELSPFVFFHGVLFTSWMVLVLMQTTLVAVKRTDLHMRMGIVGAVLAPLMLVVGAAVAIAAAKRGAANHLPTGLAPALEFLIVPLGDLALFGIFVAAGLYHRRTSDVHKRLMLMATIALLNAALSRLLFPGGALAFLGLPVGAFTFGVFVAIFVVACWLYDRVTRGYVHPAFLWSGALILLTHLVRPFMAETAAWYTFARWLTA